MNNNSEQIVSNNNYSSCNQILKVQENEAYSTLERAIIKYTVEWKMSQIDEILRKLVELKCVSCTYSVVNNFNYFFRFRLNHTWKLKNFEKK
jgi:hypothetical protein